MIGQASDDSYILVNTFTPVEGGMDALVAFQLAEMQDMGAEAAALGWLGNEVYRSRDGASLVVVTRFRSSEARERWARTRRSQLHVRKLRSLVNDVASVPVTLVAVHGERSCSGEAC